MKMVRELAIRHNTGAQVKIKNNEAIKMVTNKPTEHVSIHPFVVVYSYKAIAVP